MKECYPRDEGWGWNLPKMHAFAKMPYNILKFGLANNFSGNIGAWALKGIVNSLTAKSVLMGEKLVHFGRYVLNFVVGIVHCVLHEMKT
jgi:hypothetical protein